MPITTEGVEPWASFAVRIPPELAREVEQYAEDIGEEIMSNALRLLIAAGLERKGRGDIHTERTIIANAKAAAIRRLDAMVQAIIAEFRESQADELGDEADEDDEEGEE